MSRAYVTFGRGPKSPGDMFQKAKYRITYLRQRPPFLHAILVFVKLAEALVARAHEQPWSSPHTAKDINACVSILQTETKLESKGPSIRCIRAAAFSVDVQFCL